MARYELVNGQFIVMVLLFSAQCGLFCLSLACACKNIGTATFLASIIMLFQMLFAGFLINSNAIPPVLGWIPYLSFFKYALEAMIISDIGDGYIEDTVQGVKIKLPAAVILKTFGFNIDRYWTDFLASVIVFGILLVILFLLMKFKMKERK